MMNEDTKKLLDEDNAGIKMAVASFHEILPKVKNEQLRQRLIACRQEHEQLGDETHRILSEYDARGKDPSPIAKGMSWIKTNVTLSVDPSDSAVADLMIDGCNMGVKSLNRYLNQYKTADAQIKGITEQLIRSEDRLAADLRTFL